MKKTILIALILGTAIVSNAQNIGGMLNVKAKDVANKQAAKTTQSATKSIGTSPASKDTKAMEGTWKVDGVVVTTENEALKNQITAQEEQYNAAYKGSTWVFKKDGTISISLPKSESSPGGTGTGKYQLNGDKINMEINNQPGEYDLKFEEGQMLLINVSPLNSVYYVFVK
ncbi:MAG: lipocalin family protein [Bacteroidia bacterium]|nr:lipocalin family protein [Bacteroidia bacterium]